MNQPIYKRKRFWAILAGTASAGYYVVQGNYPAAVQTLLTAIGLGS